MYFDKRVLYVILGIFIFTNVAGLLTDKNAILSLLLTLPAVLIAITFHEFAHGYAAYKLGDDTAKRQGRLSLNPLNHLDPIGTIMLIFAGFGWGKPVEIEPRNFDRRFKMSVAEAIVAAAGPIMNFVLAFVFAIIYFGIIRFIPGFENATVGSVVMLLVRITISINVGLGIFNLIPLPPLDGSKILGGFLPYNVKNWFERYYNIFYIVFLVIWITGIAGMIISPLIRAVTSGIIRVVGAIFGITVV